MIEKRKCVCVCVCVPQNKPQITPLCAIQKWRACGAWCVCVGDGCKGKNWRGFECFPPCVGREAEGELLGETELEGRGGAGGETTRSSGEACKGYIEAGPRTTFSAG